MLLFSGARHAFYFGSLPSRSHCNGGNSEERVVDRLWLVADGTCKPFDEDLAAYRQLVLKQRKREREEGNQK